MKINAKLYRVLLKVMIALVGIVVVGTLVFLGVQISGRNRLYGKNKGKGPNLENSQLAEVLTEDSVIEEQELAEVWQEGDIRYDGKIYRYNEDILTFLLMGIDEMGEVEKKEDGIEGGQSDAIFLVVLDPHSKEVSVVAVNRDTMTEIEVYSKQGTYIGTSTAQLTLQHAYGDGAGLSCERSVNAVSKLFYDLPIHGYCAINMGAIALLNDAVGGVEVTALEDIIATDIKEGDTILLKGLDAYCYLHNRDITSFNSAGRRLDRQKQYITKYVATAKEQFKEDITLPVKLYSTLSKYMVTDIAVDEVSYLATQAAGYTFDSEHIYSLKGETVEGEEHEEFYADEEALYEMILDIFYEEVAADKN